MATLEPLISTRRLGELLHDDSLRIADCRFYLADPTRGHAEYLAGHIPTARYFSLDDDLTGAVGPGRHPLPDPTEFAAKMGQVGIGNEHTVVVYDDQDGATAARMWWMLRSLGHEDVSVLDGGWRAWVAEPRSQTGEVPTWEPAVFAGAGEWTGTIDRKDIAADDGDLLLIDARSAPRYCGDEEPIDPIAGHIPGAFNIPYAGNVDATGRFRAAAALAERFSIGQTDRAVVCYCGSGVTACHNLLALEVAGHPGGLLYPGSWSDWCASDEEIATRKRK